MIITCDICSAKFKMDDSKVKPSGTKVRCSRCKAVFVVYPQKAKAPESKPLPQQAIRSAVPRQSHSDLKKRKDDDSVPFTGSGIEHKTAPDPDEELDLDFDNLNFDLDVKTDKDVDAVTIDDPDDVDLDMDFDLSDASSSMHARKSAETDDLDIDLDMDFDLESTGAVSFESPTVSDNSSLSGDMEISLDMDINQDFSLGKEAEKPDINRHIHKELDLGLDSKQSEPALADSSGEDSIDFDLDLDLGLDSKQSEPALADPSGEDSIDFDLDLDLGLDSKQSEPALADPSGEDSIDFDLDLDLGLDSKQSEPALADPSGEDSIDFDLDLDLGLDSTPSTEPVSVSSTKDDGLDLSLDLDLGSELAGTKSETRNIEKTDDFELDFDFALGENVTSEVKVDSAKQPSDEEGMDLDLDLELELEGTSSAPKTKVPSEEIDLDLDLGLDDGDSIRPKSIDIKQEDLSLDLVLDLDKLEKTEPEDIDLEFDIQSDEDISIEKGGHDIEFSLDLDLDDQAPKNKKGTHKADEFSFDLDLEDDFSEPVSQKAEKHSGKQFEATIFADELNETNDATIAMPDEDSGYSRQPASVSSPVPEKPVMEFKTTRLKPKEKSGKAPLVIFIFLIALIAGGYYAVFIKGIGREKLADLPYIGKYFGVKSELKSGDDRGIAKINFVDYRDRYVKNQKEGNLFIIEGKIINNYNMPRSGISISGKIFTAKKEVAQQKTVFAGNLIANTDLSALSMAEIEKRLSDKNGLNGININVPSGREVPFMIVFSKLPDNIERYSVEIDKSF